MNTVLTGDCLPALNALPPASVDLLLTDPPFNIGINYAEHDDRQPAAVYLDALRVRLAAAIRTLSPTASVIVAIGPRYQADVFLLLKSLGLHWRQTVVWHYTFGPAQRRKFTPSWTALHYFTVSPKRFVFNADAVRVPSDRQLKYKDKRANPAGKLPDDVWTFSRVCGTFKERVKGHPCQMPLALLDRLILALTNPGDVVLDPYAGTGSTLVSAKRCGRRFIGMELTEGYVADARERLEAVERDKAG